jgi:hypothetical protein
VGRFTEDDLREVVRGYEATKQAAMMRRDATLREFHARGWRPVDLQRATGYSRETIRQALHPEVRRAANTSRRKPAALAGRHATAATAASARTAGTVTTTTAATTVTTATLPGRPTDTYASYGDRKPYVVAERLEDLHGPTAGTVQLPPHLDWSGNASYDLDKPARLASMYRTVLNEAGSTDDLRAWIDGRVLARLWSTLWLPPKVRRLWENRFPELASLRAQAG